MTRKTQRKIALAALVAPFPIAWVLHEVGVKTFLLRWDGTLFNPRGITINIQNFGVALLAVFLIGATWLIVLGVLAFFRRSKRKPLDAPSP